MDTTKYSPAAGLPSEERNTVQASCLSIAEEQMVANQHGFRQIHGYPILNNNNNNNKE
jgi:hypothetical protein